MASNRIIAEKLFEVKSLLGGETEQTDASVLNENQEEPVFRLPDPARGKAHFRRSIADLLRAIVSTRRGVSEVEATEFCKRIAMLAAQDEDEVQSEIHDILEVLKRTGDLGSGVAHGTAVLVALPEIQIGLPDGRRIHLGDSIESDSASHGTNELFPPELKSTGPNDTGLFHYLERLGYRRDVIRDILTSDCMAPFCFTTAGTLPAAARNQSVHDLLHLAGIICETTGCYELSPESVDSINGWLDLASDISTDTDQTDAHAVATAEQQEIAELPEDERVVVEAGPGTGKTFLACERIADLVARDVPASRILVLSFTRVAVAELRQRITERSAGAHWARAVDIATFDSFAGRFSGGNHRGGFDAAMTRAVQSMQSDPAVKQQ